MATNMIRNTKKIASSARQHPATRLLSTAPSRVSPIEQQIPIEQAVKLDFYSHSKTLSNNVNIEKKEVRLPNDVHERNNLYKHESARTMNGITGVVRHDWSKEEIAAIYNQPFVDLMYEASSIHRMYWDPSEVQQCTLLSIKTGGCTEDCSYCSQSTRHKTFVKPTPTMKVNKVLEAAKAAKDSGSTRFCMGAAWRELGNKSNAFKHILEMVKGVKAMDLEVCCTLGMLTPQQAMQLKDAGLTAYNHNLDTSPEHYPKVITTRSYQDRLDTLAAVRDAGISVCCGGILGLGEEDSDRVGLLHVLATLPDHPESVPINALVKVEGTPLGSKDTEEKQELHDDGDIDVFDMARMIATARIVMPRTMVRLSAGRQSFSEAEQYLLFQAGANSMFYGEKLLTTGNPDVSTDVAMMNKLGFKGKPAFQGPLKSQAEMEGHVQIM